MSKSLIDPDDIKSMGEEFEFVIDDKMAELLSSLTHRVLLLILHRVMTTKSIRGDPVRIANLPNAFAEAVSYMFKKFPDIDEEDADKEGDTEDGLAWGWQDEKESYGYEDS